MPAATLSPSPLLALLLLRPALGLDNGVGLTPQMGWSSWNDAGSQVNESWVKTTARYLIESGLAAKGWDRVNVDEGWMLGRDPKTYEPVEDRRLFPSGMRGLGEWVHAQEIPGKPGRHLLYGLYTSRGQTQCSRPEYRERCLHVAPNPKACLGPHPTGDCGCEGTQGFEAVDGAWMVAAGADYLKEDSCGGSQDHATAFRQYAAMRDVLNKTGKQVFFSLCGWWNPLPSRRSARLLLWLTAGIGRPQESVVRATRPRDRLQGWRLPRQFLADPCTLRPRSNPFPSPGSSPDVWVFIFRATARIGALSPAPSTRWPPSRSTTSQADGTIPTC